jgi:CRISPR-associated exonuclease Cas4
MKSEYAEDELLQLSGIQHFCFCRRRWALINVEQQWKDNVLTVSGELMHERADDPFYNETRKDVIISRSMPVVSYRLGLTGICDVVEFVPSNIGAVLNGKTGKYKPNIVEYKHGKEDPHRSNEMQLCAQAICLEEMLSISIESGFLFYGAIRRRAEINFSPELRDLVWKYAGEMHDYFERGYTPKVKASKACRSCSLIDICLPGLSNHAISASKYIQMKIDEE